MSFEPVDITTLFAAATTLGATPLSPAQTKSFASAHGLNPYVPLPQLRAGKVGPSTPISIDSPNLIQEVAAIVSQLTTPHDYNLPLPEKTCCIACLLVPEDIRHFQQDAHKLAMSAQLFRLGPLKGRTQNYQEWLYSYRVGFSHQAARGARAKLYYHTFDWPNGGYTRFGLRPLWDGPQDIPLITGKVPLGELPLKFTLSYSAPTGSVIRAVMTSAADEGYTKEDSIKLVGHHGSQEFIVRFYSRKPGCSYYSIQLWLEIVVDKKRQLFPLVTECSIMWFDPEFNRNLEEMQLLVPKTKGFVDQNVFLSRTPDSDFNPPKETSEGPRAYRVLKLIRFVHHALVPYTEVWVSGEAETLKMSNRKALDGPIEEDPTVDIKKHLSLTAPVTINNLPYRNLLEIVGQVIQEEDEPLQAPVLRIFEYSEAVLVDLDMEDVVEQDSAVVHVFVRLLTSEFKMLKLNTKAVRLVHPDWTAKFTAYIKDERSWRNADFGQGTELLLQLNSAVASLIPQWVAEEPCRISVIPPMGLCTEYLMGIYHHFLHDELPEEEEGASESPEVSSMDCSPPSSRSEDVVPVVSSEEVPTAMEVNTGEGWEEPDEEEGPQSQEAPVIRQSSMDSADTETSQQPSRRVQMLKKMRCCFYAFFSPLFHGDPQLEPSLYKVDDYSTPPEVDTFLSCLDPEQRQVMTALTSGHKLIICQAPPGTGKTHTLGSITASLVSSCPTRKILCVAPTNAAANVLTAKIVEAYTKISGQPPADKVILRYLRQGYPVEELPPSVIPYCAGASYETGTVFRRLTSSLVMSHSIIVATVDLTILDVVNTLNVYLPTEDDVAKPVFNYVFIDEAASVDLPRMSLILPLAVCGQALLVGDTDQLPAYITSQRVKNVAGDESAMEFLSNILLNSGRGCLLRLEKNYRSRAEIIEPSNMEIYVAPKLKAVNDVKLKLQFFSDDEISGGKLEEHIFRGIITSQRGFGVAFSHVEGNQMRHGTSWYNPDELYDVVRIVEYMVTECFVRPDHIGIDSTYASQGAYLKQLLQHYPAIRIGCSNCWQGNERPYMILTLVRSVLRLDAYGKDRQYGFLDDLRRLNVSLTRARLGNIVVGNAVRFANHPLIREYLRQVCKHGAWIQPLAKAVMIHIHNVVCERTAVAVASSIPYTLCDTPELPDMLARPQKFCCTCHSLSKPKAILGIDI